jgi:hypothetical protein
MILTAIFSTSPFFSGSYQVHLKISSKNYVRFNEMKFNMKRIGERAGDVTTDAWLCPLLIFIEENSQIQDAKI